MTSPNRLPFPSSSYSQLAQAEAGHWWFRMRNQILIWALEKKVGPFDNFLEVGCGTGYVLEGISRTWPKVRLQGSEYFEEGLFYARKRIPNASFQQLDVLNMSEKNVFDVIGAFDVIEHIEQDEIALHNLERALGPGGTLMLTVPQHSWLWSNVDEYACHVRRYSRADLLEKVRRAGLEVSYVSSFVSLLVPLMWFSRKRAVQHEPMSEFDIPRWLNCVLSAVMQIELILLKIGVRFPVGGSLLIVANKRTERVPKANGVK